MKTKRLVSTALLSLVVMLISASAVFAAPGANLVYYETDLGNGTWQYDYTFNNTSSVGEYLYAVDFTFNQFATVTGAKLPSGWMDVLWEGTNSTDYIATASLDADIAPGNSLGGFSFTIDYRAGNTPYEAYVIDQSGDTSFVAGTTAIVPEPVSSLLFVIGGVMLACKCYCKKRGRLI